jgi:hypothetical protein
VPLTQGLSAVIDEADLAIVAGYAWAANTSGSTPYAVTHIGRRFQSMHRLIMAPRVGEIVDHIDRDGLNNRRSNLVLCTKAENSRRRMSAAGRSAFKGVAFHKASGLYHATINVDGRQISLRYHKSARAAAQAYDDAAIHHHGAFALTNQMMGLL